MPNIVNRRVALLSGLSGCFLLFGAANASDQAPASPMSQGMDGGGKTIVTPELLLSNYASKPLSAPAPLWLPDGRNLVMAIESRGDTRSATSWIEKIEIATGRRERLVAGTDPKVAPDGSAIAFVTTDGKDKQLSVYDFATRQVRNLVPFPPGMIEVDQTFAWAPDSRSIVFAYRPAAASTGDGKSSAASTVLVVGAPEDVPPDSEIWLVDVATSARRKIASDASRLADAAWLPDGTTMVFTSMGSFEYRNDNVTGKIFTVSLVTGEKRDLVTDGGVQNLRPMVSPGGRVIAFTYDPSNLIFPYYWNVAILPAGGGAIRQLTRDVFVTSAPIWSQDGKALYFTCKHAVFTQICSVGTNGVFKRLTNAPRNAASIAVSPRGDRLAWSSEDARGRVEIRTARTDGTDERVVADFNPELDRLALAEVNEISWKSRDGLTIPGLLIKPLNHDRSRKYPLIVDIHGGPVGGVSLRGGILKTSPLEWQMWAAKGYAVLVPDYRASAVPGWDPILKTREAQDYNARDMDDVMAGVDDVIAQGIADPERLAVIGHSAGSILTNWIITHSRRFKVAVSYEGWVDWYHGYGSGLRVGGNAIMEWTYKGKPWEVPENYRKNSPSEFVRGVSTPTMFISADYKGGSGVENLYHHEFMYTAWKKQKVDTQLLIYRGEGHVIQQPGNQRDMLTRILGWIDPYME
jgi:dipeptidyl aminopeptidase/acylaminoacyl peptidase